MSDEQEKYLICLVNEFKDLHDTFYERIPFFEFVSIIQGCLLLLVEGSVHDKEKTFNFFKQHIENYFKDESN